MSEGIPLKQIKEQVISILAFYRTASEAEKAAFEAEMKDKVAAVDPQSRNMFLAIIAAAKLGKTLEQAMADLEKLA